VKKKLRERKMANLTLSGLRRESWEAVRGVPKIGRKDSLPVSANAWMKSARNSAVSIEEKSGQPVQGGETGWSHGESVAVYLLRDEGPPP